MILLSRCIISGSKHGFQGRQSRRLHQFHLHAPVLSVARRILGAVAEHILVPQLDSDLGGHVGQFRQIIHREVAAAGLLGDLRQQARAVHLLGRAAPCR